MPCSRRKVERASQLAELHDDETSEEWLSRADDALYAAKRAGRNATSIAKIA